MSTSYESLLHTTINLVDIKQSLTKSTKISHLKDQILTNKVIMVSCRTEGPPTYVKKSPMSSSLATRISN